MAPITEGGDYPQRPQFTPAQQVQAGYIGRVTGEHHRRRPAIVTHAIDNVTPDIVADRDDGIFVEVEPNIGKGYRVHVTIADVAAHVRLGSPLSDAAWQRAFTVYKPGSTDSMFPKILEENLSLEHRQERLGLTINITLDEHFNPVHTSFTPVITTPDNASYEQARQRMSSEPQFGLMARIADGIRRSYSATSGVAWEELIEDRRMRRGRSDNEIQAMEMVATYMLLTNNCVAEFFSASGLPFLYRNFDNANDAHAAYGTEALRHSAVESMGFDGAYCHFTSPIRRAPDYFNGAMAHYAVDVLTEIEQQMKKICPALDAKILNDQLWQHGPQILKLVSSADAQPARNREALKALLHTIANTAASDHNVQARPLTRVIHNLELPPVPLSKAQLDAYASHINALTHSPQMAQISKLNEKFDKSVDTIARIADTGEGELAALSPDQFSSILQAAATTGEMPAKLFDETMTRLANGNLDRLGDLFAIFIQAQYPSSERWRSLKREIAKIIKNDPGTVNALLYRLDRLAPDAVQESHSHVLSIEKTDGDERPSRMHSALLVMTTDDGSKVAAPFFSVGHDTRAALSHARYSFLEHYAFSELQPIEQTAIPNLLYADLDLPDAKKRELFERMVKDSGAELVIHAEKTPSGYRTTITVSGGDITVPITTEAEETSKEAALQTALRRMLRNDAFKIAMSRHEGITQDLLNPQTVLEEELAKRSGSVDIAISPVDSKSNAGFCAVAIVHVNGTETTFSATEPNKSRALRVAAAAALESLGSIHPALPGKGVSWSSQANRPPPGSGQSASEQTAR